ncbi:MAG: branched-chain amino acid ABC transporter permease [Acidimicrobiales bacterium]
MHQFFLALGFGLVTSGIIALSSVAMSLQYSVTRSINFAHGDLMTVGAYLGYVVAKSHGGIALQVIVAIVGGAFTAYLLNALLFRPFRRLRASNLTILVLTIAASLIIQNVLQIFFSGNFVNYPLANSNAIKVGPFRWTAIEIAIMIAAAAILLALHFTIRRSKFGKAQRAVADDILLARTTGVSAERIINITWLIDGAIAGLSGLLLAYQIGSFTPSVGFTFLLVVFAAAVIGGIGQMYGAMIGSLIVGIVTEVSALWVASDYKQTMAFIVLVIALMLRPQGIIPALGEIATAQ